MVALEPVEALRVMGEYGNPFVCAVINFRPIFPTDVTAGDAQYPSPEKIHDAIRDLSQKFRLVDATAAALPFGSPIFSNITMVDVLAGARLIPMGRKAFEETIRE